MSDRIPDYLPKTRHGLPDMRYRAANDWVSSVVSECTTSTIPHWVPRKKDGSVNEKTAIGKRFATVPQGEMYALPSEPASNNPELHYSEDVSAQEVRYRIPECVPKRRHGLPDMRCSAAKHWVTWVASECTISTIPHWVPRKRDGSVNEETAIGEIFAKTLRGKKSVPPSETTPVPPSQPTPGPEPTCVMISPVRSLYVLNVYGMTKSGAVEQLAGDLRSYAAHIAIFTETNLKQNHDNDFVRIIGYNVYRRDRIGRRGGGVAVYVRSTMQSSSWTPSVADNRNFELQWVRIGAHFFVAALYHPPKPIYDKKKLLDYIGRCVKEIRNNYPHANIVIAGDFNQLPNGILTRNGLIQINDKPTRGDNILDRIYVSNQDLYHTVDVVKPSVSSDHMAVVAYTK